MDQGQLLRVILSLLFILGLLLALAWAARRGGWLRQSTHGTQLRILGTQSLGARCSITVVQVEDSRLVLGVTPQQVTLLHTLPASASSPDDFADALGKAAART
ncbi:flagellar biosynthetic protein FliO [Castellaniella caeni]|uniref:flagellar biosynthetic protein FliO n=1 Tax=Castellaniella caeni TaxID=266123 RepID=UPI00082AFA7D|nr:flagellar biosynthetic protein FliO [Castellaniella caeni]